MNDDSAPVEDTDNKQDATGESLVETAFALWRAVAGLIGDTIKLAALETRIAALSLSTIVGLALGIALLVVTAWLLLIAALAVWLVRMGLGWELALIGIAILNILLSVWAWRSIVHLSRNLLFSVTRRQLVSGTQAPKESSPDSSTESQAGPS